MKKNLLVCRSGGRTSEYMYKRLLDEYSETHNIVGIFANTGWEHHKTLEFVHNNDIENEKLYGAKPIWLEAVVNDGRVSSTFRVVSFQNASRNMEPFWDVSRKYGLPSSAYPHCTRELKERPIHYYVETVLGWSNKKAGKEVSVQDPFCDCGNCYKVKNFEPYETALGIRIDEPRRVKRNKTDQNKVYPLVDWFFDAPDKLDIIDWWESRDFDLGIPEHLGNCVGCFRKSDQKLMKAYRDAPDQFKTNIDEELGFVGSNVIDGKHSDKPRTMYRNYRLNSDIIKMFEQADPISLKLPEPEHVNEGCASSCEPFATDQIDMFE